MSGKGSLVFDFFDVYGNRLNERIDVALKHQSLGHGVHKKDHQGTRRLRVTGLDPAQGGTYHVLAFPTRYRPVSKFVRVHEGKTVQHSFVLPVDPDRVVGVEFPEFEGLADDLKAVLQASDVEGSEGARGADLYKALDNPRKAGLLNIYAKMKATLFENGRDSFSYVSSLTRVRAQRFFARVRKELRDEVKNSVASNLFDEVSGALHTPPPGFTSADSFKTGDRYGNLQITFFSKPETLEFIIDADIDDASGIEHIFQVIRPWLTGKNTNPYDVHEILIAYQKIDPMYRLLV
ncbi:MAG TPA: hypothetical protein VJQ56_11090 [Blastocatellia bacterium]|nr:hypothetical protein [Blastocatellia bacterium]